MDEAWRTNARIDVHLATHKPPRRRSTDRDEILSDTPEEVQEGEEGEEGEEGLDAPEAPVEVVGVAKSISGPTKERPSAALSEHWPICVERWSISVVKTPAPYLVPDESVSYKQLMVALRSIISVLRLLPTHQVRNLHWTYPSVLCMTCVTCNGMCNVGFVPKLFRYVQDNKRNLQPLRYTAPSDTKTYGARFVCS